MKKNKIEIAIFIALLLSLIHTIMMFPMLPDIIPTHWNFSGEIDGWSQKWMLWVLHIVNWGIYISMYIVPKIDPKKENYKRFSTSYSIIKLVIILLLACMIEVSMKAALEPTGVNMNLLMSILLPLTFIVIGNYLPKCKQNYTFGIKTPWTLNNEDVWNDTHRFTGILWVISGIIMLILTFILPSQFNIKAIIAIIIIDVFGSILYSYSSHKKYTNK